MPTRSEPRMTSLLLVLVGITIGVLLVAAYRYVRAWAAGPWWP